MLVTHFDYTSLKDLECAVELVSPVPETTNLPLVVLGLSFLGYLCLESRLLLLAYLVKLRTDPFKLIQQLLALLDLLPQPLILVLLETLKLSNFTL